MAALLVKDVPKELHRRLKACAARHRRSLTQEIVVLLEEALSLNEQPAEFPPALKGRVPLTEEWLNQAKREGRA